jgi:hypothetical protein
VEGLSIPTGKLELAFVADVSTINPGQSLVKVAKFKMPDFGFHKMVGDGWEDFGNFCIGYQRDLVD